jgi:hypothetical protein
MKELIRRGKKGVEGLTMYVRYFVEERGVNESLFEGKLSHMMMALEEMCVVNDNPIYKIQNSPLHSINEPKPPQSATPDYDNIIDLTTTPEPESLPQSATPDYNNIIDLTTTPEPESLPVVIGLDSFEFEDSLGPTKASAELCKGYILPFSNGKSPHNSYPFALHDTLILPWDYSLRNGVMTLFSRTCVTFVDEGTQSCPKCQLLQGNEMLEKILRRIDEGIHENAGYAYYGFSALSEVLHCRTQQLRIS